MMKNFQEFQDEQGMWSDATFGKRPSNTLIYHCVDELREIIERPEEIEEYCDAISLLIDAARMNGFNMDDILKYLWVKLEINKNRKWADPDKNGIIKHIK